VTAPANATPWLGLVADDVTGATDAASYAVAAGVPTAVFFGLPGDAVPIPPAACLVVALKTRSIPAGEAVDQSVRAAKLLLSQGVRLLYFKYCSTFDSTARGNIGPVAAALADLVECPVTLVAPSAPANGRTVYQGHLFVGSQLLSESPMRDHPINPMTDSDLTRLLRAQTDRPVELLAHPDVAGGPEALRQRLRRQPAGTLLVADAISDDDLAALAGAALDEGLPLVSGSAGLAHALARVRGRDQAAPVPALPEGPYAVISGSASAATRRQVEHYRSTHPSFVIDPIAVSDGVDVVGRVRDFLARHLPDGGPMVYSTAEPEQIAEVQRMLGVDRAAALVERTLAECAQAAVELGVRRLLVAGGETSGAVVARLGIEVVHIGPMLDPGVCWSVSVGAHPLGLVLKSGNFGAPTLFERAASGYDGA